MRNGEVARGTEINAAVPGFVGEKIADLVIRDFENSGRVVLHNWIDNSQSGGYVGPSKGVSLNFRRMSSENIDRLLGLLRDAADREKSRPERKALDKPAKRNGKHNGKKLARA